MKELKKGVDLVVSLGGDGVILYANRFLKKIQHSGHSPPILSVNFGTLGFLSQFTKEEFEDALNRTFKFFELDTDSLNLLTVPKLEAHISSNECKTNSFGFRNKIRSYK